MRQAQNPQRLLVAAGTDAFYNAEIPECAIFVYRETYKNSSFRFGSPCLAGILHFLPKQFIEGLVTPFRQRHFICPVENLQRFFNGYLDGDGVQCCPGELQAWEGKFPQDLPRLSEQKG